MEKWFAAHWLSLSGLLATVLGWLGRSKIAGWYRRWRGVLKANDQLIDCENSRSYLMASLREITEAAALARSALLTQKPTPSSPAPERSLVGSDTLPNSPTPSTP